MYDRRPYLSELSFLNPQVLEGGETRDDGASDPCGVFALGRSNDVGVGSGGCERLDLCFEPVFDALEHGVATSQHDVAPEVFARLHVRVHDRVVDLVVDARGI